MLVQKSTQGDISYSTYSARNVTLNAYYVQNQNSVFCTFLDSTKAFDRVNYCKLFKLLVKRELPLLIITVLANLYMNNSVRVYWVGAKTISQLSKS